MGIECHIPFEAISVSSSVTPHGTGHRAGRVRAHGVAVQAAPAPLQGTIPEISDMFGRMISASMQFRGGNHDPQSTIRD
jgi:hypothetical protein